MPELKYPIHPILLVDDEINFLESSALCLQMAGVNNILSCSDSREVMKIIEKQEIDLLILDISMPHLSGIQILSQVNKKFPAIPTVMLTADTELETAVKCMRLGAVDYLAKPVETNRFITSIKRALEMKEIKRENSALKKSLMDDSIKNPDVFKKIKTVNKGMRSIFKYIEAISGSPRPVLVTGETGVGKELIANVIHNISKRKGNFISVNIAGLDDTMFADTLFGHKKGAYTGAEQERQGFIENASHGTLFLDEIGDLDFSSQVKLLRLLQEGEYYPLGSDTPKRSTARIIVATHQNLKSFIGTGKFRKDLYYRLRTHAIHIPPLRERKDDLPALVDHFLESAAKSVEKKKPTPPNELFTILANYNFPGNIRELENIIFDAVSRHKKGILSTEPFNFILEENPDKSTLTDIQEPKTESESAIKIEDNNGLPFPTLKGTEKLLIREALKRTDGNQTVAARMLGISRAALNKRINRE